jgi:hypothetical protein
MRCRRSAGTLVAAALVANLLSGCAAGRYRQVDCSGSEQSVIVLIAQAVPSATLIPCLGPLPVGWSYAGSDVGSGLARFWLDSDRAGPHAVEVRLTESCDVSRATRISASADRGKATVYRSSGSANETLFYVFDGGCVTRVFSSSTGAPASLARPVDLSLRLAPRSHYVESIRRDIGLTLCGAGSARCSGES